MALGGWNPSVNDGGAFRRAPATPTLDTIRADSLTYLDNYMDALFHLSSECTPKMMRGGRLRPLTERLLATELMYFEECLAKYGMGHSVVKKMIDTALTQKFVTTRDSAVILLKRWGSTIKVEWQTANIATVDDGSAMEQLLGLFASMNSTMALENQSQRKEIKSLHTKVDHVGGKVDALSHKVLQLQGMIQDLTRAVSGSSSRKRSVDAAELLETESATLGIYIACAVHYLPLCNTSLHALFSVITQEMGLSSRLWRHRRMDIIVAPAVGTSQVCASCPLKHQD
jgi:hypothetical protein